MLISIEGIDGSGKGTLAAGLVSALVAGGRAAVGLSFPQYGANPFADEIGRYLNHGLDLNGDDAVRYAALLYAADRATVRTSIRKQLQAGAMIICDRYVESNLAHQVARAPKNQRDALYEWISDIEYRGFEMPRPTMTFLLNLDVETARSRVREKARRLYTDLSEDAHESDTHYLERTRSQYLELASRDPSRWTVVEVVENGRQRTPKELLDQCLGAMTVRMHV